MIYSHGVMMMMNVKQWGGERIFLYILYIHLYIYMTISSSSCDTEVLGIYTFFPYFFNFSLPMPPSELIFFPLNITPLAFYLNPAPPPLVLLPPGTTLKLFLSNGSAAFCGYLDRTWINMTGIQFQNPRPQMKTRIKRRTGFLLLFMQTCCECRENGS